MYFASLTDCLGVLLGTVGHAQSERCVIGTFFGLAGMFQAAS
jgi:hypothetical protein